MGEIQCRTCGSMNSSKQKFCLYCQALLEEPVRENRSNSYYETTYAGNPTFGESTVAPKRPSMDYHREILESGYVSTFRWILLILCCGTIIGAFCLIFISKDKNLKNFAIASLINMVIGYLVYWIMWGGY